MTEPVTGLADHPREAFLSAIDAAVRAALPGMDSEHIHRARVRPVRDDQLPCINIYQGDELVPGELRGAAPADSGDGFMAPQRRLTVHVELMAAAAAFAGAAERAQNARIWAIEGALAALVVDGHRTAQIRYAEMESVLIEGGKVPLVGQVLSFAIWYRAARPAVDEPAASPPTPYGSWDPDIGPGHEGDYRPILAAEALL